MKNPYQVHAFLSAQAQAFLGGQPGDGNRKLVATLTIWGLTIPCTHSELLRNWILESGKSPTTIVEHCEFLVSDLPATVPNTNPPVTVYRALQKGELCGLQINPTLPVLAMRLWVGGLIPGGLGYRFMLVDANYRG